MRSRRCTSSGHLCITNTAYNCCCVFVVYDTQAITLLDQLGLVAKDPRQVNDISAVEYPSLPKGAQRVFHNVSEHSHTSIHDLPVLFVIATIYGCVAAQGVDYVLLQASASISQSVISCHLHSIACSLLSRSCSC
jgi:hypothetical protein